jgi:hypothetical protein
VLKASGFIVDTIGHVGETLLFGLQRLGRA